eukprot:1937547-Karenia_brevis.AAC.1
MKESSQVQALTLHADPAIMTASEASVFAQADDISARMNKIKGTPTGSFLHLLIKEKENLYGLEGNQRHNIVIMMRITII